LEYTAMTQTALPCTLMRAGTSRGPFFLQSDLPTDPALRDRVLLAAIGSPDAAQIDGLGGGTTLTSKAAIVSASDHPEADLDYRFAQVSISEKSVDTRPSCGNMLSGVVPFAIERGLIAAEDGETRVRIRDLNTGALVEAVVQTPGGELATEGDTAIDGVPGTAAPIRLDFRNIEGAKTGALLPTGNARDTIDGIAVTCIDAAMPMVLIAARDLGKTGGESAADLEGDAALMVRIEKIRRIAGARMGLGDVSGSVIPKVGLLSAAEDGGTIRSRYFTPATCHAAHAVTGAIAVAAACRVSGSVAARLLPQDAAGTDIVTVEHPSGKIAIAVDAETADGKTAIRAAGVIRTARRIMSGALYIPVQAFEKDAAAFAEAVAA
jgi:4-oxalomesaconate tautomerase